MECEEFRACVLSFDDYIRFFYILQIFLSLPEKRHFYGNGLFFSCKYLVINTFLIISRSDNFFGKNGGFLNVSYCVSAVS